MQKYSVFLSTQFVAMNRQITRSKFYQIRSNDLNQMCPQSSAQFDEASDHYEHKHIHLFLNNWQYKNVDLTR